MSANKQYTNIDEQAESFVTYLSSLSNKEALQTSGVLSAHFCLVRVCSFKKLLRTCLVQNNFFAGAGNIIEVDAIMKDNFRAGSDEFVDYAGDELPPAAGAGFLGIGSDPRPKLVALGWPL